LLTESFVNSCFSLVLCKKTSIKKSKALYRDIYKILTFQEDKKTLEIPVLIENKINCLKKLCKMLIEEDKTIDSIVDSVMYGTKFDQFRDFLDMKLNEELKDAVSIDILKQIRLRGKVNNLFQNYDDLNKVLTSIKDGTFDSIDDLVEDYESTIKKLYSNVTESNRAMTIEATASLDLAKDNFEKVIEMIQKKYDRSNKTPSGFNVLDSKILHGGFDPSRLYIFGGGSGSGKSTMLNNLIIKSATTPLNVFNTEKNQKKKVFIYITLENTIEEALLRTYQPMFNKTLNEVLQEISSGVDIKKRILEELNQCNTTIIMKYFPAMSISVVDVMGVVDDVIEEYGIDSIMGLYIDYLDLLRTDIKYDIYRMELGHITLSLKTLAVQYNIPVITATQLGRSAYEIKESSSLRLDQMSESIKKVEHADFVCLLGKDPQENSIIHGKIGKNRAGVANISISFKVDFSKFKFLSGSMISNKDKQDEGSRLAVMSFANSFEGLDAKL